MKRLFRYVFFATGLGLLAALLGAWWLLGSETGRDQVLARATAAWPQGALRIGAQEGSLAGGLRLRDVTFDVEGAHVAIARIDVSPRLPGLREPTLHVARLRVQGVRVTLMPVPETPEVPWVERLPKLDIPFGIHVDELGVSDVRVQPVEGDAYTLTDLSAAVLLDSGRLKVSSLRASAPLGRLSGEVNYEPANGYATQAQLNLELAAGGHALLAVDGALESGEAQLSGRAEGPWQLALSWTQGGAIPAWHLQGEGEALEPQAYGLVESPPLGFAIDATGQGAAMSLQGHVRRGEQMVGIAPSALRWERGVLYANPLELDVLQGRVRLMGNVVAEAGEFDLTAEAANLRWGDGDARVQADGQATLSGTLDAWRSQADLVLQRGSQRARFEANVEGVPQRIVLPRLRLTAPEGRLDGSGEFVLDDSKRFGFDLAAQSIDPAWFLPEWPGELSAQVQLSGAAPADRELVWRADATGIRGTLRGESVSGEMQVAAHGDEVTLDADLIVSDGLLRAKGRVAPTLALALNAQAFDIAPWWQGASGVLDGEARVQGTSAELALQGKVNVRGFALADITADRIQLDAQFPNADAGTLRVNADGLVVYGEPVDAFEIQVDGRLQQASAQLRARAPRGSIDVDADWSADEGFAAGELTLRAAKAQIDKLPAIALQAPGTLRWSKGEWSLPTALCLNIAEAGRLCAQGNAEQLNLQGTGLNPAWATALLPEDTATPPGVMALFSLEGRVGVQQGAWESSGVLRSTQAELQWRADAQPDGALSGEAALNLSDLSLLDALSADIAAPRGKIQGQLSVSGTLDAPRWSGVIDATPLSFDLPALGIAVSDGSLRVSGGADGQLSVQGRLPTGDGALTLQGEWQPGIRPLTLSLRGNDVRVLDTPDGQVWISPALDLVVDQDVARLRGRVEVPRAALQLDRFEQTAGTSPDVVVVDDAAPSSTASVLALDADFVMALSDEVRLKGFGFDGRLSGELRIRDRIDRELRASGRLALSGELRAYGQQLDLTRGEIRWANAPIDEPVLDVLAERPDSEPRVGVALTGSALSPVAEVWSKPALPQAEALSWLMFGRPLSSADGQDAAQLEQAATSLGGSALAQVVAGKVGLDSASVGQSRALGGNAVTLGKRITPKLYVSYGMALSGTGQVVTVTYALRRWLAAQLESGIEQRVQLEATFDRD